MKSTLELLDSVKAELGISSDYALAKALNLSRAQISKYRGGHDFLSENTALKVAEILRLEPSVVLATIAGERAKTAAGRAAWMKAAARLATAATVAAVAVIATEPLFDQSALVNLALLVPAATVERLCIM